MDTIEELGGTYFYHGNANVTPKELFWLIFAEGLADHLGIEIEATAMSQHGQPKRPKRVVLGTKINRTSIASKLARAILKNARFPFGIRFNTSVMGHSRPTNKIGTVVGRAIPFLGSAQVVILCVKVASETRKKYNLIAKPKDQILWTSF